MRYTKFALLIFAAGLLLGLAAIVAEIDVLSRLASATMALGLAAILPAVGVDLWRAFKSRLPRRRRRAKPARRPGRARSAGQRRPRQPAAPKRGR